MNNIENQNINEKEMKKRKELSKLATTFFRNALRSNLDLTSLADTKAGILISINGFILTVIVTASGFAIHNSIMTYAFISIIFTSLGSILFSVLAVKPRRKEKLLHREYIEGYNSLLYYQDMADLSPKEYAKEVNKMINNTKKSQNEMVSHLHILGTEIKKKYFWLTRAYTFFSLGLIISASLIVYALMYVEKTPFYNLSKGNVVYTKNRFYNIFEPSGATTMVDGKVLIVEDESSTHALKLVEVSEDAKVVEIGDLYIPKKIKKIFKKGIEDLEAITADGKSIYAITSHSVNRNGEEKKSRDKLLLFHYDDGAINDFYEYKHLKEDLYSTFPKLFAHSFFSSDTINIEGLCFDPKTASLLIGFRAPLLNGDAFLIAIKNPKAVLEKRAKPRLSSPIVLHLKGMGIRDITYDAQKNLFWILAGSSQEREGHFQLWKWDKENAQLSLVKNAPDLGYGEGITVVNQKSKNPALFIVEDNGKKPNKPAQYVVINKESL